MTAVITIDGTAAVQVTEVEFAIVLHRCVCDQVASSVSVHVRQHCIALQEAASCRYFLCC
jgi:hypothetical protein